jgi:flagellar hook protein FlgE
MSITSSFYSALSGLDSHATAMQVIGDNVANIHTTAFKGSAAHFEDILGQSLSGVTGSSQTGAGAKIATVDLDFYQGSFATTNVSTDVAINGRGFFVVNDSGSEESFYTRAGHFTMDNEGYYVNTQGHRVQGYLYDSSGDNLIETLADIQINQNSMIPPSETASVEVVLNLDASDDNKVWDDSNPYSTCNFSTALNIYDSLGQSHQIQVYYTKTSDQNWAWHAMIDGDDVSGGTAGVLEDYGAGVLTFDADGQLTTVMPATFYDDTPGLTFANGLTPGDTEIDFTTTTQFGSPSAIQTIIQDGYGPGMVSGVGIDETGNIVATYTNGTVKNIARLAIADFTNLNGLTRKGATLYQATTTSGQPLLNKPGVGGMGVVSSSMLEESNVDIAAEFVRMIVVQRGYQANSKVISTTDEMLAQLMNIR